MSSASDEDISCTPYSMKMEAEAAINNILPESSKERYLITYDEFMKWRKEKRTWKDLKKNARHDNALRALAFNTTGNTVDVPIVSELAKKVLNTIGHESSTGIGPAESIIGPISGDMEINTIDQPLEVLPPSPTLHLPPYSSPPSTPLPSLYYPQSRGHILENEENIPPPTRSTSYTQPARPARATRPHDAFIQLQQENNAILQNMSLLLAERNDLLRQQNAIMEEANDIARRNRFSRRSSS